MSDSEEINNRKADGEEAIPTASFGAGVVGPGGHIGPYKLLSVLGEGGFAVVYLAEQQRPVKRRVALKVIKPGMDSKQVIARFEAERQALALLDHPNIAYVFNAGTTEAERPYFVMEYVKGVPLTEHCDRQKLGIEERLGLFLLVCEGVQHAHQKGIIHRDIKPSNVLVSIEGEKAVPKIIDFGVAKAIAQPLTERTLYTERGQLIGTPEYMSPEQAEMTAQDIDTRTDIYSLGVMLYELLTGVLPFEAETLREGGFEHIRQVIREEEPKTPSTRLSTLGVEESTRLAQRRRADVGALQRRLRGDLDWITLKAMEKDRTRRYLTAHAFAEDIQRHLSHEPVLAGPPSTVYKIKKFVRRNRASVTAATAVAAAIIVGFVVSTTLYFQADQAREKEAIARTQAEQAQQKEVVARSEAVMARDEAEQAEKTAQQQRLRAERLLARAQLERGVKLLNEGNCLGLLDLLDARITADKIPELRDSAARLWAIAYDPWSDRLVHVIPGADNIAYSPDGRLLATSRGRTAQLWDTATGQPHGPPLPLEKEISAVVFSPDGKLLATHSVAGVAQLWDTATCEPAGPVLRHDGGTFEQWWEARWSAAFSPDGKLLATGAADGTVRLWETDTGQPYGQPLRHEGEVWMVAFSPDGKLLASGSKEERTARLWDVVSGQPYGQPLQHEGKVEKVAFSPDGKLVATKASGAVSLWKTETGQFHARLRNPGWVGDMAFSPDGKLVATASSEDWTAWLWDTTTGEAHGEPLAHDSPVWAVAFSPDGGLLATGSLDQTLRLWEVLSRQPYGQPLHHQWAQARKVVFSPDGKSLAIGGLGGGTTRIWRTYQRLHTDVVPYQSGAQLGAVSPDGKVGAIISGDKVHLWDTTTVKALGEPLRHDDRVSTVVFSPDGKLLATGSWDKAARLWNVPSGQPFGPPLETEFVEAVEALVFSPDGNLLAAGDMGWFASVFEVATGRRLYTLTCTERVYGVAFSPDGKVLASGVQDGTATLWDVATGQQLTSPLRHRGPVWGVAYSPDGNLLATASGDKAQTIRLWNVTTGPPYHSLALPPQAVGGKDVLSSIRRRTSVGRWAEAVRAKAVLSCFSSDGTVLVGRTGQRTARVWCVPAAPTDLHEMEVRTWVALGAQHDSQGEVTAIPWSEWQKLREELRFFEIHGGTQASWPQLIDGGGLGVSPDVRLTWVPGLGAVAHNVYFGTSPEKLKLLGKVEDASYANLPALESESVYWCRVDTVKSDGSVIKGNLWSFSRGKMVGWWKFDETEGRRASDSSGIGNDGTLVGEPQWQPGQVGGALLFDGDDDYVEIPKIAESVEFTYALWLNQNEIGSGLRALINHKDWVYGSVHFELRNGHPKAGINEAISPGGDLDAADYTLPAGEWHHVALVKSETLLLVYVDGEEAARRELTMSDTVILVEGFIGAASGETRYFDGLIDDVRIYSYALLEAEVAAIYGGEGPGPIARPKWVVEVGREEYAPLEPEPEKVDEYYVPLGSELERQEAEQRLIEKVEALEIKHRVLGEEHPETLDTLYSMNRLARLYGSQGRYDEAEQLLVKALEIRRRMWDEEDPNALIFMNYLAHTLNNLAWFQATSPVAELRNGAKAIENATKACELTKWKNPIYLDTLAAAYAEAGDFDSAVKWQKEAMDLLPEDASAESRADYESRLTLYEAGKPYRESP